MGENVYFTIELGKQYVECQWWAKLIWFSYFGGRKLVFFFYNPY